MKILVTGGAGYIGSHMVLLLKKSGHEVVVLDNLSNGHRESILDTTFVPGDIGDRPLLDRLMSENRFDAVMHFASFIQVGESVTSPTKYYNNNVSRTLVLLDAMIDAGVKKFIFSSTAAIFGIPSRTPIDESHPKYPVNPYGRTKLFVEEILADYGQAYGLKSVALRYFNAAGADPDGRTGERHHPETHLIPLILKAASGERDFITVYGRDYDTPDGTCIRDYIHVIDLCEAHLLALMHLESGGDSISYNLGNGQGFSVLEVIAAAERVTQKSIRVETGERRAGDPPRLVADSRMIKRDLGWAPCYPDIDTIIRHAWQFESKMFPGR
ncbi:MAG: UDP-glucose 4-epimerase GalE [Nitrospiraceae bacterium]|nr:UDP-glucose 4-epimerase GalE [Nitrospiraceae bacterium]